MNIFTQNTILKNHYKSCCENKNMFLEFCIFFKNVWNKKQKCIIHNIDNTDDIKKMTNNMKDILHFWNSQRKKIIYYGFHFDFDIDRINVMYLKNYDFDKLKCMFLSCRIRDLKKLLKLLKIQKKNILKSTEYVEDYCLHILYNTTERNNSINIYNSNNIYNSINIYKKKFIPTLKIIYEDDV